MLNKQIRQTIQQFRDALPPEMNALLEQGAGEISALDIIERAVKPGDLAPEFTLSNQHGQVHSLSAYLAQGPLVITFYRGIWCPYCNLQLRAYYQKIEAIRAAGAQLVAISPEKPEALAILKQDGVSADVTDLAVTDVDFDILYDEQSLVAGRFGIEFELPDSHKQLLAALSVDIEALTGSDKFTFPDPATYIINPDQTIRWAFIPNNYRKRAEPEDILSALAQ